MTITDGAAAARTFAGLMVSDQPRPEYAHGTAVLRQTFKATRQA